MRGCSMAKVSLESSVNVVAVHDIDLEKALRRLDIYQKLISGTMNCMICEETVNMENLGALMRVNGKVKVICDRPACFSAAMKMSKALKE